MLAGVYAATRNFCRVWIRRMVCNGSRREELNVSKCFLLYAHNRKSAPISITSGQGPYQTSATLQDGGCDLAACS